MNHQNEEKVPVIEAIVAEVETDEKRPNRPVSAATDSQGKPLRCK